MSDWQPIETAPVTDMIDVWMAEPEGHGWRFADLEVVRRDPWVFRDVDGQAYHPHENGCWPTHWMPQPAPPK